MDLECDPIINVPLVQRLERTLSKQITAVVSEGFTQQAEL